MNEHGQVDHDPIGLARGVFLAHLDTLDEMGGRLCNYFSALDERLGYRDGTKITLEEPDATSGFHELVIPAETDGWRIRLVRVLEAQGRKAKRDVRLDFTFGLLPRQFQDHIRVFMATVESAEDDAIRSIAIMERFLADPDAAIARSGRRCFFCRKPLVDELSKARGIGPDCYGQHGDLVSFLRPKGVVAR